MNDSDELRQRLRIEFDAEKWEIDAVVAKASSEAFVNRFERDAEKPLSVAIVLGQLRDSGQPTLWRAWNWWTGSLNFVFGGYEGFKIDSKRKA